MVALNSPKPRRPSPKGRPCPERARRIGLGALVVALAALLLPTPARAQLPEVEPYYAATAVEGALLRSHPTSAHYPVAKLPAGRVVRVDGENQEWARVAYPRGVPAFLPADAAEIDTATRTATLTKPTQLKAFNMNTGLPGSWKPLLLEALPAGTRLTLLDPEPADDTRGGRAYRVAPPGSARVFVQRSLLRPATADEVAAFKAEHEPSAAAERPTPGEPVAAAPVIEAPTGAPPPPAEQSLAQPIIPPVQERAPAPGAPAPAGDLAAAPPSPEQAGAETPAETLIDQSRRAPGEATEAEASGEPMAPRVATPEELEAAYLAVTKQPAEDAEFGELMAEYERSIASLDDSPYNRRLRARLGQRLELLRIRADLQEQMRKLAEAKAADQEDQQRLARRMAEVQRTMHYTMVGRLSASALYDGQRLPLMYRVQSSGGAARTLGYIRPEPGMKLESKLGQIVGIVGDPALDPSLRLNVINARRVDVLEPATAAVVEPSGD